MNKFDAAKENNSALSSMAKYFHSLYGPAREGVLICDKNGSIFYFNSAYGNFIGKNLDELKGLPLKQIRPHARAPEVLRSGESLIGIVRKEHEKEEYFCNIYPITLDGKIEGTISVVTFANDLEYLNKKIQDIERENFYLNQRIKLNNGTTYSFKDIIAEAESSKNTIAIAKKAAAEDISILLQGESGTGKELYAQSIHNESPRRDKPFVAVNCATFSRQLLESELFGYEEGSFTGSLKGGKMGLFEAASGGTLFLDEISEMDIKLQSKLLRALQERKIRRVGSNKEIEVDVRIIAACNVDLNKYISEGKFRQDLYYRISVIPIEIEPLRERKEDIAKLSEHFLDDISRRMHRKISLAEDSLKILEHYDFAGNIRELRNILEFSSVMCSDGVITPENLPGQILENPRVPALPSTLNQSLAEKVKSFEKREIEYLLAKYGDNLSGKKKVAEKLGISLATLYNKLQ